MLTTWENCKGGVVVLLDTVYNRVRLLGGKKVTNRNVMLCVPEIMRSKCYWKKWMKLTSHDSSRVEHKYGVALCEHFAYILIPKLVCTPGKKKLGCPSVQVSYESWKGSPPMTIHIRVQTCKPWRKRSRSTFGCSHITINLHRLRQYSPCIEAYMGEQ